MVDPRTAAGLPAECICTADYAGAWVMDPGCPVHRARRDDGAELLPCPFCGGEASMRSSTDGDVEWAHCKPCRISGPLKLTTSEAIAAWNARATPSLPAQIAAIEADGRYKVVERRMEVEFLFHLWGKFGTNPIHVSDVTAVIRALGLINCKGESK